jgi:NitT/TauT family transport system permease protein
MNRLTNIAPALALLALLALVIGGWWLAVIDTRSVIFPTPAQVAAGTLELAADGNLWRHIGC